MNGITLVHDDHGLVEVRVDATSAETLQVMGPIAWVAFVTLALAGHDDGGVWVTRVASRDLAARLGIGRDRAATALIVLRRHGLIIEPRDPRRGSRFTDAYCELRVTIA